MPNGTPPEEWGDLEKPLLLIDPVLTDFAQSKGLEITRNYHSSPNRNLFREDVDGVVIKLQISPITIDSSSVTYGVYPMAWRDTQEGRYMAGKEFGRFAKLPEDRDACWELLESAWAAAEQLRDEEWTYHPFPPRH